MKRLYLDTETWSTVPIAYGTHAYVADPEFEILMFQYAWDDGPVIILEHPTPRAMRSIIDEADEIVIHKSDFDRHALARVGVTVPIEKIHDTMVRALLHSLPASLDKLCEVLRVPQDKAKLKSGKRLIHLFTKPLGKNRKLRRATKETHPVEWQEFREYGAGDIVAMREVYKRIPFWNWKEEWIAEWRLDQRINDRGVLVDLDLCRAALRASERAKAKLSAEVKAQTAGAVSSTTQRAATLAYAQSLGADITDLKGGTIDAYLKDPDVSDDVRELLTNRSQAAATSPAKYKVFLNATSADGRLRGTIQFAGAARTGRDAGRLVQLQNLVRSTIKALLLEFGIKAMKADCEDVFFDDVMELCASAVRGALIAEFGKKFTIADLANIEGRKGAWLAGEEWKLQAFRDYDTFLLDKDGQRIPDPKKDGEFLRKGPDLYKVTAGGILGKDPSQITDDERQGQGKVPELACLFGGALGAFTAMGAIYGVYFPDDEVIAIVKAWRKKHPMITKMWYAVEDAMISAIRNPGEVFRVRGLSFLYEQAWLRMRLPSGRYLCYPQPEINGGKYVCHVCEGNGTLQDQWTMENPGPHPIRKCNVCEGTGIIDLGRPRLSYMGVDQYTRQWKRIETYGARVFENATQAAARDIFYNGIRNAEAAGYSVVMRVHDELVCEVPDEPEYSAEKLAAIMATNPPWAEGLPTAAAGFETDRYRKG